MASWIVVHPVCNHQQLHPQCALCLENNAASTRTRCGVALYPGRLLTPVFVACSTNAGEGLVKLSHVQWHTWTCGGVAQSWKSRKWVHYRSQTQTAHQLSVRYQTVLATFLGFRKPLYSCTEVMCHTSTHPGTSLHMTQAFPHVSTASDKRWGEKAWVQGYATSVLVLAALFSKQSAQSGCSCWWLHTGWTTIHEAIFLLCKSDCCFLELA